MFIVVVVAVECTTVPLAFLDSQGEADFNILFSTHAHTQTGTVNMIQVLIHDLSVLQYHQLNTQWHLSATLEEIKASYCPIDRFHMIFTGSVSALPNESHAHNAH